MIGCHATPFTPNGFVGEFDSFSLPASLARQLGEWDLDVSYEVIWHNHADLDGTSDDGAPLYASLPIGESDPSLRPTLLDYAGSSASRGNTALCTIVILLATCAGLFGALMLFYGIPAIVYTVTRSNSRDFPGDLLGSVMFLLIGAVCLYVCVRWCRAALRMIHGR